MAVWKGFRKALGQQQLLLIILAILILGTAIVVGVWLYTDTAQSMNRKTLIVNLHQIGDMAQKYYRTPEGTGGGGRSFTGFNLPLDVQQNANGTFSIAENDGSHVHIVAIGRERGRDGVQPIRVELVVNERTRELFEPN